MSTVSGVAAGALAAHAMLGSLVHVVEHPGGAMLTHGWQLLLAVIGLLVGLAVSAARSSGTATPSRGPRAGELLAQVGLLTTYLGLEGVWSGASGLALVHDPLLWLAPVAVVLTHLVVRSVSVLLISIGRLITPLVVTRWGGLRPARSTAGQTLRIRISVHPRHGERAPPGAAGLTHPSCRRPSAA